MSYQVESEFMGQFCSDNAHPANVDMETDEGGYLKNEATNNQVKKVRFDGRGFYDDITYVESPLYVHLIDSLRYSVAYREMKATFGPRPMVPAHVKDFVDKITSIQNFSVQPSLFDPVSKKYNTKTNQSINVNKQSIR